MEIAFAIAGAALLALAWLARSTWLATLAHREREAAAEAQRAQERAEIESYEKIAARVAECERITADYELKLRAAEQQMRADISFGTKRRRR